MTPVTFIKVAAIIHVVFIVNVRHTHIPLMWPIPPSSLPYTDWSHVITPLLTRLSCSKYQFSVLRVLTLKTNILLSLVQNINPGTMGYTGALMLLSLPNFTIAFTPFVGFSLSL